MSVEKHFEGVATIEAHTVFEERTWSVTPNVAATPYYAKVRPRLRANVLGVAGQSEDNEIPTEPFQPSGADWQRDENF